MLFDFIWGGGGKNAKFLNAGVMGGSFGSENYFQNVCEIKFAISLEFDVESIDATIQDEHTTRNGWL